MWVNWFQWAKSKTRVSLNTLCSRAVVTHWINTSLSISWEETEPGAGEDGRGREGEVLLLLLAGPQRHRQREGNIGADDGGAGRGARSTGTSNSVCVCVWRKVKHLFSVRPFFVQSCGGLHSCPVSSPSRFRSSRGKSLRASCSASKEGWSSTQGREKRRRKTHTVRPHRCFKISSVSTNTQFAAIPSFPVQAWLANGCFLYYTSSLTILNEWDSFFTASIVVM